jgi:mRNA degradation ribonuclease J1/J2
MDAMTKVIPLGGLGEIGLNMMVFEHDREILVIDGGLMFPEAYMPGVDVVIPDVQYLKENRERVKNIILTTAMKTTSEPCLSSSGTSTSLCLEPVSPWNW